MITKKGYVMTAAAVAATIMPKNVRIVLVENLVRRYGEDNPNFKEDEFRFACGVYVCRINDCGNVEVDRLLNHQQHVAKVHPDHFFGRNQ